MAFNMTIPTTYYLAARDFGHFGFDAIGTADSHDAAVDLITESFRDDAMPADLTTVQVWHITPDAAPRDVTDDLLTAVGAWLSARHLVDTFPAPFLNWADFDIMEKAA
jgi:hypothetical protein